MKKKIGLLIIICTLLIGSGLAYGGAKAQGPLLRIFSPTDLKSVKYSDCENPDSQQWVETVYEDRLLFWEWKKNHSSWCGWGIIVPQKDLTGYWENAELQIIWQNAKYSKKNPPQIKFVGFDKRVSSLMTISDRYKIGEGKKGKEIFRIPLKNFYRRSKKSMKNVQFLQFDAHYKSEKGAIDIVSITIEKH